MTLGWLWDGGGGAFVNFDEKRQRFLASKVGPGTKSTGARMHQGCTKDAPGMHQGCTCWVRPMKKDRHIQAEPTDTEQYISH